jgi:plastocyanin
MIWGMNAVPANAATIQVTIDKLVFSPVEVKAKVGDTITWINMDIVAHTATARGDWDVMIYATKLPVRSRRHVAPIQICQ